MTLEAIEIHEVVREAHILPTHIYYIEEAILL